jgi:hypothetical protein
VIEVSAHDHNIPHRIEVALNSIDVDEGRQQFPAQSKVHRQTAIDLSLILPMNPDLRAACIVPRTRYREVGGVGDTQQKVPERAGEDLLVEGQQAVIVRRGLDAV